MSSTKSELWQIHEWETAFFGVSTARITVPRINAADLNWVLTECHIRGVRVVHYLADANDDASIRAAEQAGFHLVDVRMTLEWNALTEPATTQTELVVRTYRVGDLPWLEAIARTSFWQTRYYYDQNYPRERCHELYATWISKSCQGDAARVIVAEQDGIIVGFVTCQLYSDNTEGAIGLVGISAEARGMGIGRTIVTEAQRWFAIQGTRRVRVVTQTRNIAALALYQRCGFVTSDIGFWYHKWIA